MKQCFCFLHVSLYNVYNHVKHLKHRSLLLKVIRVDHMWPASSPNQKWSHASSNVFKIWVWTCFRCTIGGIVCTVSRAIHVLLHSQLLTTLNVLLQALCHFWIIFSSRPFRWCWGNYWNNFQTITKCWMLSFVHFLHAWLFWFYNADYCLVGYFWWVLQCLVSGWRQHPVCPGEYTPAVWQAFREKRKTKENSKSSSDTIFEKKVKLTQCLQL